MARHTRGYYILAKAIDQEELRRKEREKVTNKLYPPKPEEKKAEKVNESKYAIHISNMKTGKSHGKILIHAVDDENANYQAKKIVGYKPYRGMKIDKVAKHEEPKKKEWKQVPGIAFYEDALSESVMSTLHLLVSEKMPKDHEVDKLVSATRHEAIVSSSNGKETIHHHLTRGHGGWDYSHADKVQKEEVVTERAADTEFGSGSQMRAGATPPARKFKVVHRTTGAVRGIHNTAQDAVAHHNALSDKGSHKVVVETAPPGAKYERMVKHIKGKHPSEEQKKIAYATAWKRYKESNPVKEEKEEKSPFDASKYPHAHRKDGPYSRVRHLARMALKKQIDKKKVEDEVKEETVNEIHSVKSSAGDAEYKKALAKFLKKNKPVQGKYHKPRKGEKLNQFTAREEVELGEAKCLATHGDVSVHSHSHTNDGSVIDVIKKGKKIASGDFDSGADSFFISHKSYKGQKSFDTAHAIAKHFANLKEAFSPTGTGDLGEFKHGQTKKWFNYGSHKDAWATKHNLPHQIHMSDKSVRYGHVKGTVAHVAVDENPDGTPKMETWPITKHSHYAQEGFYSAKDAADKEETINELSMQTKKSYVGSAEKSFRANPTKQRAVGIKRALGKIREAFGPTGARLINNKTGKVVKRVAANAVPKAAKTLKKNLRVGFTKKGVGQYMKKPSMSRMKFFKKLGEADEKSEPVQETLSGLHLVSIFKKGNIRLRIWQLSPAGFQYSLENVATGQKTFWQGSYDRLKNLLIGQGYTEEKMGMHVAMEDKKEDNIHTQINELVKSGAYPADPDVDTQDKRKPGDKVKANTGKKEPVTFEPGMDNITTTAQS